VLTTGGEAAIRVLSELGRQPAIGERPASTSGGVADWTLTDKLWATLTDQSSGEMLLSGQSAARLFDARREATRAVNTARGWEERFSRVVSVERDDPALTCFQLYWETIERVLGSRPLTILDPNTGRTHLYLSDPERFNLNLMNAAPALHSAPVMESQPAGNGARGNER
jgi:hypothetical protein